MIPTDWMPHRRRSDGELVGYLVLDGDGFVPLTIFGYPLAGALDLEEAETLLEERGLAVLAQPWLLALDDGEVIVRIQEVTGERLRVVEDPERMANVVGATLPAHTLPVPAPHTLRLA